jgi:hypothetical protein
MKQVPYLHSMGLDLPSKFWYGYMIVLMDTCAYCIITPPLSVVSVSKMYYFSKGLVGV